MFKKIEFTIQILYIFNYEAIYHQLFNLFFEGNYSKLFTYKNRHNMFA